MDWIKVKVKHTEYDFMTASDNVFRSWIRLMTFVAFIERKPTKEEIKIRLGKESYFALEKHLKSIKMDINLIINKVMEDVSGIVHKREGNKKRQAKSRESNAPCNAPYNALHNAPVTQAEEIREEKIRVDKRRGEKIEGSFDPLVCDLVHSTLKDKSVGKV